jgi:hypothetical protein
MDLFYDLWAEFKPLLILGIIGTVTPILFGLLAAVKRTAWYKRQPWVVRKVIDVALQTSVNRLMPEAERLKQIYGELPKYEAELLQSAAVQDAMDILSEKSPEVFKAIPAQKIEEIAVADIPRTVEKVKTERARRRPHRGK